MQKKSESEISEAIERQRQIVQPIGKDPAFAPRNGICWKCREQIYAHPNVDGSTLVTGCPWCYWSYCE